MRKMYIAVIKYYSVLKFVPVVSKTIRIIKKNFFFSDFEMLTGPNLGKKCVRLSDPSAFHEIFGSKTFKKKL